MPGVPEIDEEKCTGCGDCVDNCPTGAAGIVGGLASIVRPDDCDYCTECEVLCPSDAITCPFEIVFSDGDLAGWRAADARLTAAGERRGMTSPEIQRAVTEAASPDDSRLGCAVALGLARRLGVTPGEVGDAANQQKVRIVNCQLGFFAVEKSVHDDLEAVLTDGPLADAIDAALAEGALAEGALAEGRLSCADAFSVATETRSAVKLVGDTATKRGVRIVSCQLGCFP